MLSRFSTKRASTCGSRIPPFTVKEVKVALWYNALQGLGDLTQVVDDIVIHKWGFPVDEDQDW